MSHHFLPVVTQSLFPFSGRFSCPFSSFLLIIGYCRKVIAKLSNIYLFKARLVSTRTFELSLCEFLFNFVFIVLIVIIWREFSYLFIIHRLISASVINFIYSYSVYGLPIFSSQLARSKFLRKPQNNT